MRGGPALSRTVKNTYSALDKQTIKADTPGTLLHLCHNYDVLPGNVMNFECFPQNTLRIPVGVYVGRVKSVNAVLIPELEGDECEWVRDSTSGIGHPRKLDVLQPLFLVQQPFLPFGRAIGHTAWCHIQSVSALSSEHLPMNAVANLR